MSSSYQKNAASAQPENRPLTLPAVETASIARSPSHASVMSGADASASTSSSLTTKRMEDISERRRWRRRLIFRASCGLLGWAVWAVLYFCPLVAEEFRVQQRCAAMVALATILWSSEALPLWVTSMLIPLLAVMTQLMRQPDGQPMPPEDAAKRVLTQLASGNVMLLFGGFSVAAALHKYNLACTVAEAILRRTSPDVKIFSFVLLLVSYTLSGVVNNVAGAVLMNFLVTPILHKLEDRNLCAFLVMIIACGCNLGGIPTPIASPQNAAAQQALEENGVSVSFAEWMGVTIPLSLPLLPAGWAFLILYWRPKTRKLPPLDCAPKDSSFGWVHYYVIFVTLLTVSLWCTFEVTKDVFGSRGIVSLVPVILLYGAPNVLGVDDLKKLDWHILFLLGGGGALGEAVESSGLLTSVAGALREGFHDSGLWAEFNVFNFVVMFASNFISHTVAAIALMPVIAKVGCEQSPVIGKYFVMASVLLDSVPGLLPVSSFPNVLAYGTRCPQRAQYVRAIDYVVPSLGLQVVGMLLMGSLGYFMMQTAE